MQFNTRAPSLSFKDRPMTTRSLSTRAAQPVSKRNPFKRSKNSARPSLKDRNYSSVQHEQSNLSRPQSNSQILMERKASINCVPKDNVKPKKLFETHRNHMNYSVEPRPISKHGNLRNSHDSGVSQNFLRVAVKYSQNTQLMKKKPSKLDIHSSLDL